MPQVFAEDRTSVPQVTLTQRDFILYLSQQQHCHILPIALAGDNPIQKAKKIPIIDF